jgi:hypothetical protein
MLTLATAENPRPMLNVCGPKLRKLPETFVDPVKTTAVEVNVGALVVE